MRHLNKYIIKVSKSAAKLLLGLLKCSVEERIDSLVDVLKNLGAAYMGK
jgi:hypothetical protein